MKRRPVPYVCRVRINADVLAACMFRFVTAVKRAILQWAYWMAKRTGERSDEYVYEGCEMRE